MTLLVPLPVVLPLLGAAVTLGLAHRPQAQRILSVAALLLTLGVAVVLLVASHVDGPEGRPSSAGPPRTG